MPGCLRRDLPVTGGSTDAMRPRILGQAGTALTTATRREPIKDLLARGYPKEIAGEVHADPITGTSPKILSGRTSDCAQTCARVPRLVCHSCGRPNKPRGPRMVPLVATDSDFARSCTASCAIGGWNRSALSLLRCRRHYAAGVDSKLQFRVLVQNPPRKALRSSRRMHLSDRAGFGQWLRRRSLQAFAFRAACQGHANVGTRRIIVLACGCRGGFAILGMGISRGIRLACRCGPY